MVPGSGLDSNALASVAVYQSKPSEIGSTESVI